MVCICTRNRPDDLRRALASIRRSSYSAAAVVVSDDSTDTRTRSMVAAEFPATVFREGPRRGLGANRNTALVAVHEAALGTHVLFIDDDVELAPDFLAGIAAEVARLGPAAARTVLTGAEINNGVRVVAHRPNFLGYQNIPYRDGEPHQTFVINSTVFPADLFTRLRFDPSLVYGCEEIDLATRAVLGHGYAIRFLPELANFHYPSPVNRDFYRPFAEASRIYTQFKRYGWVQHRPATALGFLLVAHIHLLMHYVKTHGIAGLPLFWRAASRSCVYILRCWRDRAAYV